LSPCNNEVKGIYQIIQQGGKMHLVILSDECIERAGAFKEKVFEKIK